MLCYYILIPQIRWPTSTHFVYSFRYSFRLQRVNERLLQVKLEDAVTLNLAIELF